MPNLFVHTGYIGLYIYNIIC